MVHPLKVIALIGLSVSVASRNLHLAVDHALANSFKQNAYDGKTAYVAHVTLVKGIPFYGFHVGYRYYFKIYLLNPLHITRLADLLRQGAVLKCPLQPYESHLQYIPQWMCDYNLYGCAYMDCAKVKFRAPVPEYLELSNPGHRWHDRSIPPECISNEADLPRQSHCTLEVDVCVQDIMNRHAIKERPLHHDFIERVHPISPEEKLVHSMASLWQDETRRRKKRLGIKDPGSSPFQPEELVSMSASPRDHHGPGWIHEEEFRQQLHKLVAEERASAEGEVTFDTFVRNDPQEVNIKTALESVKDFYPENIDAHAPVDNVANDQLEADMAVDGEAIPRVMSDDEIDHSIDLDASDGNFYPDTQPSEPDIDSPSESSALDFVRDVKESEADAWSNGLTHDAPTSTDELRPGHLDTTITKSSRFSDIERVSPNAVANHSNHGAAGGQAPNVPMGSGIEFSSFDIPSSFMEAVDAGHTGSEHQFPVDSRPRQLSSKKAHSKGASQNQRLSFAVVKDPRDPVTVARFSQKSTPSKTASQLSQAAGRETSHGNTEDSLIFPSDMTLARSSSTVTEQRWKSNSKSQKIRQTFDIPTGRKVLCFSETCPTPGEIAGTMGDDGRPTVIYQDAYFSNDADVPERPRNYAGREFRLESNTLRYLPEFDKTKIPMRSYANRTAVLSDIQKRDQELRRECTARVWEFARLPPSRQEVVEWWENELRSQKTNSTKPNQRPQVTKSNVLSQIEGATQKNPHGFKYSQKQPSTSVEHQIQYMSVMSLEIHVNTRGSFLPNPEEDEIAAIFWCVQSDDEDLDVNSTIANAQVGVLAQSSGAIERVAKALSVPVETEEFELDLINRLIDLVRTLDPDVLTGYEVHNSSWGYVIERARHKYGLDLCDELSRVKVQSHGRFDRESDRWGFNKTSSIHIAGRHVINIWRAMRSELNLLQYTMENVVFQLLHRRIPHYSFKTLTSWYSSDKPRDVMKVMEYFLSRVQMDLEIIEANELIPRTSEQARVLGVDFFSVFSRGSQFKVESLMFRIAKPENYILISPSRKQVGQQNALECLPLVMEPQSDFYTSPLLVLDFQSLYPSIIIAYNYCYSTFLGRLVSWRGRNKMGFTDYDREPRLLELLKDHINIAPNGMMYAKPEIRRSLLARMLSEILETRVMVKSGMKIDKDDKTQQRLLNHRQLALKMIANVTYGYTSASFSGRMPCSEIADSIVQTGRETLERAIEHIHSVERWGAEVVYGDTDSLFVYLKGKSRDEAFSIGEEIAKEVTKMNPRPVKLKFEKVYHPCVLLAKKRYVGFKYEHRDQKEPEFDAKGIETVRRDGTPAEQKIEEKALKILFKTADLSQVKEYFQKQCAKIMQGKVSVQDFCFAREVRMGTYSDKGQLPAGALISTKKMQIDARLEPQYGERVPYVVVAGAPGSRLIDRCVAPEVLLENAHLELDAEYYITKNIIPPLERIFNLVGANVRQWYDETPKVHRMRRIETGLPSDMNKKTLESYMRSLSCLICRKKVEDTDIPICQSCSSQHPDQSMFTIMARLQRAERRLDNLHRICRSCMGVAFGDEVSCDSKDCPVFYSRTRDMANWKHLNSVLEPIMRMLEAKELEW